MYNGFANYETYKCQEEFFSGSSLEDFYSEPDITLESFKGDKEAMTADLADELKAVVEESLAFSADYHTSSDVYTWAMRAVEHVNFVELADLMMSDWF